jgi:hypothetical protein
MSLPKGDGGNYTRHGYYVGDLSGLGNLPKSALPNSLHLTHEDSRNSKNSEAPNNSKNSEVWKKWINSKNSEASKNSKNSEDCKNCKNSKNSEASINYKNSENLPE